MFGDGQFVCSFQPHAPIDQDSEARPDDDISKTLRKHGIPVARQELALPRARAMSIGRVPKSN